MKWNLNKIILDNKSKAKNIVSILICIYIDPNKFSGLAFGLGVERISMIKYGVNDIREFYKSNLDFLSQFK